MPKKSHQTYFASSFPVSSLEIDGYKISYEDHKDSLNMTFSQKEQKKFQELLHEAQIHPKQAYVKVLEWQSTVQNSKELDNLLTYLHLQNKQIEKAENLTLVQTALLQEYFATLAQWQHRARKSRRNQNI